MSDINSFVHLHVHTEFSLLDGAIRIDSMLNKAEKMGMEAVAVTDHGNMFGGVHLFTHAAKTNVKPILGCEVYVAPGDRRDRSSKSGQLTAYHLVLLIMNEEGYKNLSHLVSRGHTEGFYYHPRVDMELLKEYNKGLIALSACLKGVVPYYLRSNRVEEAKKKAQELARIFDKDRFYLEVQANMMQEQNELNSTLKVLSYELSLPLVATNDCHYLERKDSIAHDSLLCIQTGKTVDDPKRLKFSNNEFFFKSREEMASGLRDGDYTEALNNTVEIAKRCRYKMKFGDYKYPVYYVKENKSLDEVVREEALKGLEKRLTQLEKEEGPISSEKKEEYYNRLDFELGIITGMDFSGYFLIVADFIDYARKNDIPIGPGRGSAAGSLVIYSLGITNLDPIKYDLIFERFLNPERISMPDVDIDFCINGREEVINYVAEKYGRECVGQIITFGTMKARGVIRDVGRSLNIPYGEVDKIAKLVPEGPGVNLTKAIDDEPDLKRLESGEEHEKKLMSISRSLEGITRHASTHASGVVIADRPLEEYIPLFKGQNGELMTQYTMDQVEKLGLIKFDFLGLKTLTVIKQALKLIEETNGNKIDIDNLPLDDEKTLKLCREGNTTGIFQLESEGMKDLLRRLHPESFEDLVALVALYRPGPMDWIPDFIAGKHGKKIPKYLHPKLEPILSTTYGVAVYQEQVMRIARDLAGFSMGEADMLRKAMGKKKADLLAEQKKKFLDGCVANDISRDQAEKIFAFIEPFAGYGFNRSHAACYALVGYQTAYLKAHFPVEFMAALLTMDMENQDKTIKNIAECRKMGIGILPPDLNESHADFSVVEGAIRFGLAAVKNVGLKAVEAIIHVRNDSGIFRDIFDFSKRIDGSKVNRRVLEGLIQCGAFDFTAVARSRLFASLDDVIRLCGANQDPNQLNIFSMTGNDSVFESLFEFPELDEWNDNEKLRREKEALGFYITGHPLDEYKATVDKFTTCTIQGLLEVEDKAEVKVAGVIERTIIKRTKKGDRMAVLSIEDQTGSTQAILWPDVFEKCSPYLKSDEPLLITGRIESEGNFAKIIAKDVESLKSIQHKSIKTIELAFDGRKVSKILLEEIRDIFFRHPGNSSVVLRVSMGNAKDYLIKANNQYRVLPCEEMFQEIEGLIGQKVVCQYSNTAGDQMQH